MIRTVQQLLGSIKGKRSVITIDQLATAQEVAVTMKDNGINLIVVTKNRKPVGVISTSDTSSEFASGTKPSERHAFQIMKRGVIKTIMTEDLDTVAKKMVDKDIRHIIVGDRDDWIAVLSIKEVLEAVRLNKIEIEEALDEYHKGERFRHS